MPAIRTLLFLLAIVFCCSTCKEDIPAFEGKTKRVIIILVDGPRWSETWGDSLRQYIPYRTLMAQQGVLLTNFRNEGFTYTNAGHTAIINGGHWQINNSGQELPPVPGLFQYYRKTFSAPADKVWLVASKDKLHILSDCQDPEWQGRYRPSFDVGYSGAGTGYRPDSITHARALDVLRTHHPDLMMISYREPDYTGHTNNWTNYLAQVRITDQYVWQIFQAIQSDPYYAGNTAIFVTNDHGRHLDGVNGGFGGHGDACEGCRKIELLAIGPDFKTGVELNTFGDQRDLCRTTAYLLGMPMPTAQGKVMSVLFK